MTSPRLTLSDAYRDQTELLRAMTTRAPRGSETSVTITRNAKLQYQFSVEVAHADCNVARDTAIAIADQLEERFPADGGNGTPFDD